MHGPRFELVCPADVTGLWDPDRLGQVVMNVVGNAVQYGQERGLITIGVSCSKTTATMTVHNELRGPPIPAAEVAALFEPYRRGGDDERNATGLGLGLYIVHELVHAHGGTIGVESAATGTTFRIELPRPTADQLE